MIHLREQDVERSLTLADRLPPVSDALVELRLSRASVETRRVIRAGAVPFRYLGGWVSSARTILPRRADPLARSATIGPEGGA